jgi:hypothetical protein
LSAERALFEAQFVLLKPAQQLLDQEHFWQHESDGLACFSPMIEIELKRKQKGQKGAKRAKRR